ncbi:hypothetical protein [Legionella cardiaca]|uniref:Dot/Icm T4SS effector n=1 Tax=Legionella cardiaca TaxID=1071983 RepID=A0ABY8ASW1_9GAMM|nr:hypothetical protein [Legionella cardiaca]WED43559.1 hypothetical protein PXX05_01935 [Legionella cardiaca]
MHLVIYFCGTGNPGNDFPEEYDYVPENKNVRTIFVKGCDEPEVCNSTIFPNLKEFAGRFVKKLFKRDEGQEKDNLQFKTTNKDTLQSIGINLEEYEILDEFGRPKRTVKRTNITGADMDEEIESITLCGYSRGAVTCFEVARQLNQLAPRIPVDIVADQPVPGNCYQGPLSNAGSIADCSDLTNLRNVSVILGAYTGAILNVDLHVVKKAGFQIEDFSPYKNSYLVDQNFLFYYVDSDGKPERLDRPDIIYDMREVFEHYRIDPDKDGKNSIPVEALKYMVGQHHKPESHYESTNPVHRGFFSQIVPKLPRQTHRDLIVIPRESHHQVRPNAAGGSKHMHMQLAKYLNAKKGNNRKKLGLVSDEEVARKTEEARATYHTRLGQDPTYFPPSSDLQGFFGSLKKEMAYRYIDKLHPQAYERKGMKWDANEETLLEWWQRQDKKASRFSTPLTKDLVKAIKDTQLSDKEQTIKLFKQADRWLMLKENSSTSRYSQVESLRTHLMQYLENVHGVSKEELVQLNREVMAETDYFLKHWTEGSKAASWFQTVATDQLDKAFQAHAQLKPPTEEGDRALLKALGTWLDKKEKNPSKTSRYDLVIEMYEHLVEVIENNYGSDLKQEMEVSLT